MRKESKHYFYSLLEIKNDMIQYKNVSASVFVICIYCLLGSFIMPSILKSPFKAAINDTISFNILAVVTIFTFLWAVFNAIIPIREGRIINYFKMLTVDTFKGTVAVFVGYYIFLFFYLVLQAYVFSAFLQLVYIFSLFLLVYIYHFSQIPRRSFKWISFVLILLPCLILLIIINSSIKEQNAKALNTSIKVEVRNKAKP